MSAWSTIINTILAAGTWTNYGSKPVIIILYSGSIRVTGAYIILEDDDQENTLDHKGKKLMARKTGTLSIFAGLESVRDNIEKDIHAILLASNYSFKIERELPSIPQENVFKYEMNIEVLD